MNEPPRDEIPSAVVEGHSTKRRFSLIWLIPIVAAIAGAFLVYRTLSERGPSITIVLEAASGIEPGKTPIRYRDVQLGVVEHVTLSDNFKQVIVTARMDKSATPVLRTGTEFWVESARVTAGGVYGLSTLLSGAYIGLRPGDGDPASHFVALDTPPVYQTDMPGKTYTLRADRLGSVSAGSPIYFRGLQVGGILGHKLDDDGNHVSIFAFVRAPYDAFVREATHFWNASGIDVALSGSGVQVRTESLQSVLIGGVAFDNPNPGPSTGNGDDAVAADGAEFPLFASFDAIQQAQYTIKVPFRVFFDGSVAGLTAGAPVIFQGMKLGEVTDVHLQIDPAKLSARIPVTFVLQPQRWRVLGERQDLRPQAVVGGISRWVERGLRAQLGTSNLLTGEKNITLDFFPNAPKAEISIDEQVPVLPSVPSETQQLTEKVNAFLDKLDKAEIDKLVSDARGTIQAAKTLLASPSLRQGVDQLQPLIAKLEGTAEAARSTLATADATIGGAGELIGTDSALRYDLAQMLKELTMAARSMRVLADFLERNPNALIMGKPLPEQP
ncbi:MAG: MlaD family protein [Rhodospirillales bacterium]